MLSNKPSSIASICKGNPTLGVQGLPLLSFIWLFVFILCFNYFNYSSGSSILVIRTLQTNYLALQHHCHHESNFHIHPHFEKICHVCWYSNYDRFSQWNVTSTQTSVKKTTFYKELSIHGSTQWLTLTTFANHHLCQYVRFHNRITKRYHCLFYD